MASSKELRFLKQFENPNLDGRNPITSLWQPHGSPEGGNATLGYGHKLTDEEIAKDTIVINGVPVTISQGMTDRNIDDLVIQDVIPADNFINSNFPNLGPNERFGVLSLVFNVGVGGFSKGKGKRKTKAFTALKEFHDDKTKTNARDRFRKQAFGSVKGFVKGSGKVLPGLVQRRFEEDSFFMLDSIQRPKEKPAQSEPFSPF